MLSIFPDLLIYNFLGVTIIRVVFGFLGVYLGFKILSKKNKISEFLISIKIPFNFIIPWFLGILFIITGGLLIIGLYTQIACIIFAFLTFKTMILDHLSKCFSGNNIYFYLTIIIISLSLLFLGPGAFAVDLPF